MTRCLLVADVHANLRALDAVLADAFSRGGFDVVWSLGDVVGYGPEPDECIERLREYALVSVAGNHDLGAAGVTGLELFNRDAAVACAWSGQRLSERSLEFLRGLPLEQLIPPFHLVHGSPRNPAWEYVVSVPAALRAGRFCRETHCLVGHSHCPSVYSMVPGEPVHGGPALDGATVTLRGRLLFNPGAVGQPRDGDPRAAYAVIDTERETVTFHRVLYDIDATSDSMLRNGLPPALAWRLHAGY